MAAPETFLTSLLGVWRASAFTSNTMTDLSIAGNSLTATNVSVISAPGGSGWKSSLPVFRFLTSPVSSAIAASAPPWKPLHDGSGASLWMIFRPTGPGLLSLVRETLMGTGVSATSGCGFELRIDRNRHRIGIEFTNGGGNGYLIDRTNGAWYSWPESVSFNKPHILTVNITNASYPMIDMWLDGEPLASLSLGDRENLQTRPSTDSLLPLTARPWGTGDPQAALRFGLANIGTNPWQGELREAGCKVGVLTPTERQAIEDWAASDAGITLKRGNCVDNIMWVGNSLVDTIWQPDPTRPNMLQFPWQVQPELRGTTRNHMRAVAGRQSHTVTARLAQDVAPHFDPTARSNIAVFWELINDIAQGNTKEVSIADYWTACDGLRAQGWKVVVAPPPPHRLVTKSDHLWLVNEVVTNWASHADAIARFDLLPSNVSDWDAMTSDYGSNSGPKIYRRDGIHFTETTNLILIHQVWRDAINSLIAGRPLI